MSNIKDPILEERESLSSEGYQYTFIHIPQRVTTIVAAYIQLIWSIKNFRKSVSSKEIIQNSQAMFKENIEEISDSLWKEHCAASLRELVDGHLEADFSYALKCLPSRTNKDGKVEEIYTNLRMYKDVLNELAHLNTGSALKCIVKIDDYQSVTSINDQIFDKLCTEYIFLLHQLFKDNCMKGG